MEKSLSRSYVCNGPEDEHGLAHLALAELVEQRQPHGVLQQREQIPCVGLELAHAVLARGVLVLLFHLVLEELADGVLPPHAAHRAPGHLGLADAPRRAHHLGHRVRRRVVQQLGQPHPAHHLRQVLHRGHRGTLARAQRVPENGRRPLDRAQAEETLLLRELVQRGPLLGIVGRQEIPLLLAALPLEDERQDAVFRVLPAPVVGGGEHAEHGPFPVGELDALLAVRGLLHFQRFLRAGHGFFEAQAPGEKAGELELRRVGVRRVPPAALPLLLLPVLRRRARGQVPRLAQHVADDGQRVGAPRHRRRKLGLDPPRHFLHRHAPDVLAVVDRL